MPNRPKAKNTPFAEELLTRYLPYWPLFLGLAIVFLLAGLAYIRYATPRYEVTATLLISDEKKGSEEITVSESLNILNSKKIVENEVVVLQSRNLLDAVVRHLHLYAPISEQGRVSDRSAYTTSPVLVTAVNPETIRTTKEPVPLAYDAARQVVHAGGHNYPLNIPVNTPWGELQFVTNPHFEKQAAKPLRFSLVKPKVAAADISKQLEVTAAGKLSSIVKLKFRDEVPQRGEDILNDLIADYNRAGIDYRNAIARNTIAFVDERMRIVQRELNSVEKQIQNYKSSKGIVDLSEQGRMYLKNVGDNDQRLSEINMKLAVLDQVERYVVSKEGTSIAPATLGVADPLLSHLLEKLYQAELDRERLSKTTAENHPSMIALNDQIERMRPSVLENIRNQRRGLQASQRDLSSTNSGYNSMLQTIPQKERELLDVSRQQSIKNSIYSFLLQKREETAIGSASNIADSKVVETARASTLPVSPNKPFILLAALIASVLTGIAYVIKREVLSQKLLFRSELEQYTSIPVSGEVAYDQGSASLRSNPAIEEQLRQLRVATGLFSKSGGKKKILVTSSLNGEGKTFIAERLAVSMSLSGKKVVLLKSDLRPAQDSQLLLTGSPTGLAEFLEEETEPYEVIKGTEYKNLFVIPPGTAETQPTELLLNGKLGVLFEYLEETFDFIIMDAAPVGTATDAFILAEWSDLTYFVVRHAQTPKSVIRKLDEAYPVAALPNLSIVFNAVKARGFQKAGGYGYGFGAQGGKPYNSNASSWSFGTLFRMLRPQVKKA
ncbi:polysaccharide biosynthesis tyrosine autokinase [Flaviaesturariibacter flavus]|uniref:Polysaccharide biosynthesis tyrosine autokinase n=1 Tax=Flaviaesturariibacter flavus TaxID=2502780 RepID=A0A4R1BQ22_9BACT|nr:polysaccharide biosynthesis tyrosine autokinase [Flaviaesturariibacter flavus]TCJ19325.1 polysaccharide biosynthesis tyrosine autokinase [Flaviaesturariibacter flavus]